MEHFYEIDLKEITQYRDIISLFAKGAVAVAKGEAGENSLTIGWGGLGVLWRKPTLTIYINKKRYSKKIFDNASYFSVCFFNEKYQKELGQFYGSLSGRDVDKIHDGPFHVDYYEDIPFYKESEIVIFCKKIGQSDFDINLIGLNEITEWYKKDGVHTIYQGQVIKVIKSEDLR